MRVRVRVRVGGRTIFERRSGDLRVRGRVRVRVRVRMRFRVRVRFAFCILGFSFTEYIHAASFSM